MHSSACHTHCLHHCFRIAKWDEELEPTKQTENTRNTSLTRALQLSQSRAREAEKKAAAVSATSEQMAALLLEESAKLSAHRRWVRLLETEILLINRKKFTRPECKETKREEEEEEEDEFPALTWCLTLAICFGIGFALSKIF